MDLHLSRQLLGYHQHLFHLRYREQTYRYVISGHVFLEDASQEIYQLRVKYL